MSTRCFEGAGTGFTRTTKAYTPGVRAIATMRSLSK
jgi:hypothetical protein